MKNKTRKKVIIAFLILALIGFCIAYLSIPAVSQNFMSIHNNPVEIEGEVNIPMLITGLILFFGGLISIFVIIKKTK